MIIASCSLRFRDNYLWFWACRRQCGSNAALRRFDGRLEAFGSEELAGATGLEPAASCVTGRRSNQLNYAPAWDNSFTLLLCSPMPFLLSHAAHKSGLRAD